MNPMSKVYLLCYENNLVTYHHSLNKIEDQCAQSCNNQEANGQKFHQCLHLIFKEQNSDSSTGDPHAIYFKQSFGERSEVR